MSELRMLMEFEMNGTKYPTTPPPHTPSTPPTYKKKKVIHKIQQFYFSLYNLRHIR